MPERRLDHRAPAEYPCLNARFFKEDYRMANTRLSAETNAVCVALLLAVLGVVNVYRAWT